MSLMDTGAVSESGASITKYGTDLQELLDGLSQVITQISSNGMSEALNSTLVESYGKVADSLNQYAEAMKAIGTAVSQSAENTANAATRVNNMSIM